MNAGQDVWLSDGSKVQAVEQLNDGKWLIRRYVEGYDYDGEVWQDLGAYDVVDAGWLHDDPPEAVLSDDAKRQRNRIDELKDKAAGLAKEISDLQFEKALLDTDVRAYRQNEPWLTMGRIMDGSLKWAVAVAEHHSWMKYEIAKIGADRYGDVDKLSATIRLYKSKQPTITFTADVGNWRPGGHPPVKFFVAKEEAEQHVQDYVDRWFRTAQKKYNPTTDRYPSLSEIMSTIEKITEADDAITVPDWVTKWRDYLLAARKAAEAEKLRKQLAAIEN